MASQLVATSGNPKLKRDQIAELNAKQGSLRYLISQRQTKQFHKDDMAMQQKALKQQKKQAGKTRDLADLQAMREMGIAAGGMGFNMATSESSTIGQIGSKIKGGLSSVFGGKSKPFDASTEHKLMRSQAAGSAGSAGMFGGMFSGIRPGNVLGAGLAGFGASRFVKGKGKRFALGAGVGGLMSLFGSGGGNLLGAGLGAAFGGLGGLF